MRKCASKSNKISYESALSNMHKLGIMGNYYKDDLNEYIIITYNGVSNYEQFMEPNIYKKQKNSRICRFRIRFYFKRIEYRCKYQY
ncbi:hypothetical protein NCCP28_29110 [Niallia sp. NCCP-28]|nr:hypothetical protein NCCP28_29110 [Niallia sp. NCCP-28]